MGAKQIRTYLALGKGSPLVALIAMSVVAWPVQADGYRLGPQDKVRVKVYEWRASRDEIFEWKALNDIFIIGADGSLSLPFAGDVEAAGLTPAEISSRIGDSLMQSMGLGRRPNATVEVVEFRPFFILGQVNHSGAFPYRPGLTVLQAVSLAGGIREAPDRPVRLERERIESRGVISLAGLERINLLARKARLEAELGNKTTITFPEELAALSDDVEAQKAMDQEESILKSRQSALESQFQALDSLTGFLENELVSLGKQLGFLDTQIELVQKELTSVSSLVARGIAPAPREMGLQRDLAQVQSNRLSSESALLRARQEISRTSLLKLELANNHANDVATSLRETEAELSSLDRRAQTALHLLHESEAFLPPPVELVKFTIVRPAPEGARTIAAHETTPVMPGDTVKVDVPLPHRSVKFEVPTAGNSASEATAILDF